MKDIREKTAAVKAAALADMIDVREPEGLGYLDDDVTSSVLKEFLCCCAIPHGTHNEKAITDWYRERFAEKGWKVQIDEGLNMICDIPATSGYENVPIMALQGHTDMVCAYEADSEYDPLTDSIRTVIRRDEKSGKIVLGTDGRSSLGADCSMGNAASVWAMEDESLCHGPIRLVFTAREEIGLVGVKEMDPSWVKDVAVMVNTDGFDCYKIVAGSASGRRVTYSGVKETEPVSDDMGNVSMELGISGLKGGHSGFDIHLGRGNALKLLIEFVEEIRKKGGHFRLASISGGLRHNVIPVDASAFIVTDDKSAEIVLNTASEFTLKLRDRFAGIDDGVTVIAEDTDMIDKILTFDCQEKLLSLASEVFNGVYREMEDMPGMPHTSSNLGGIQCFADIGDDCQISLFERSMGGSLRQEIADLNDNAAKAAGYRHVLLDGYEPWVFDPESRLLSMAAEEYSRVSGIETEIKVSHVGLEPSVFGEFNSGIEMICIGTDIIDAHSVSERVNIDTIKPFALTLRNIISRYAEENR